MDHYQAWEENKENHQNNVDGRGSTRVSIYNTPICFFFTKKSKFVFGKKVVVGSSSMMMMKKPMKQQLK